MTHEAVSGIHLDGAPEAGLDPDRLRKAFGLLETWVADGVLPGAAAAVTRGGRIAGEAYVGLARGPGSPATSETLWGIASITKTMTATVIMMLVEQGALSLDEAVCRLLPEFEEAPGSAGDRRRVTLRHLLTHSSGLPGFSRDNLALRGAHQPADVFLQSFMKEPLLFEPGAYHYYSSVGFGLVSAIAARALDGTLGRPVPASSLQSFRSFFERAILSPLGMHDSVLGAPVSWHERIADVEQTERQDPDWGVNSSYFRQWGQPWGGVYSKPTDLVRFVDVFLPAAGGTGRVGAEAGELEASRVRLLSPAAARMMITLQADPPDAPLDLAPELRDGDPPAVRRPRVPWGVGWALNGVSHDFFGDLNGPSAFGHLGSLGNMAWGDPDSDVTCVLLTNRGLASGWTTQQPRQRFFSNAVLSAVY